jgi:hypothetical protein
MLLKFPAYFRLQSRFGGCASVLALDGTGWSSARCLEGIDMHEELRGVGDLTSPGVKQCGCPRRLLTREQAQGVLQLNDEKLQFLINTRQITAFQFVGEERFDSRDIDRLIDGYKGTASRRPLE